MKRFFAIFALLSLVALAGCDDVKVGMRSDMYVMYYTSTDGNIVTPNAEAFDANIISNTYKDGQGKIGFDIEVTKIGNGAFAHCSTLESIEIPEGVTSIGYGAFFNCQSLAEVSLPNSLTAIEAQAFYQCHIREITIPRGVTLIGAYAFYGCENLVSVYCKPTTPPEATATMFGYNALNRKIYVPIESLGAYTNALYWKDYAANLVGYVFKEEESENSEIYYTSTDGSVVTPYNTDAFGANIVSNTYKDGHGVITFDGEVTKIGYNAFRECTSLASITIPEGVTSIGDCAFSGCSSLAEVYCKATTPPTGGSSMFYNNASGRKIYVPAESVEAYKATEGWSEYADVIVGYNF